MRKSDDQRPCAMGRAVCGAAGLAGTILRLSAGMVAIACLGYLVAGRGWRTVKKKRPLRRHRLGRS
ncbi:MAG: hypothetical protein AB1461_18710 [Thermodesulfobacteriota bacterium]